MPPLVAFSFGALLGVWTWPFLQPDPLPCVLAGVSVGALCAWRGGAFACWALGILLGLAGPGSLGRPALLEGPGTLRGVIASTSGGREADLEASAWTPEGGARVPTSGRIRVTFPGLAPPPGARLVLVGTARMPDLTRLPGAAELAPALSRARVARVFRADEVRQIGRPRPPPRLDGARHAGLLRALWDGERSGIPAEEADLLRRTGTWHLVSISGLHIGLAALAGWSLAWVATRPLVTTRLAPLVPWLLAIGAILCAAAYTALSGWAVPALRALCMVAVAALCRAAGRWPGTWEVFGLAAAAVALFDPAALSTPSFQLSFGGVAGMILVRPRVLRWLPPDLPRPARWIFEGLATTVGATAGTLAPVAWHFQSLSPLSALANLWAGPWIGTLASPAAVLAQVLPGPLAALALWIADTAIHVGLWGLVWVDVPVLHPAVGPIGALVLAVTPLLARWDWAWIGLPALILTLPRAPPATLEARFLAIGQGDATLFEWPDGRVWLVDGGPRGEDLLRYLRRRGIRRLDVLVLSHPHPDHLDGLLPVAEALEIGEIWAPRPPRPSESSFRALASHAPVRLPDRADPPFEVLHPIGGWRAPVRDPVNDESLVVRVREGSVSFLLTGDVERAGEQALLARGNLAATILKVPHHGSSTSSSAPLLAAVDPALAVISCGYLNRYRHPRPDVLGRLSGSTVVRTDRDGTVLLRVDGAGWTMSREATPRPWLLD